MTARTFFTPKMFLTVGGAVLLLLGLIGFAGVFTLASTPAFYLDAGENFAHTGLGIIALAAVFVPGLNTTLAPSYRWIVILVGLIAAFFALYGFAVSGNAAPNTFGISNLEFADDLLHVVVAAWAFASAYWVREPARA